jgi:hypothetical protein
MTGESTKTADKGEIIDDPHEKDENVSTTKQQDAEKIVKENEKPQPPRGPRVRKVEWQEARLDIAFNGCMFFLVLGIAMAIGMLRMPLIEDPQNLEGKLFLIVGCMTNNFIGLESAKILVDWNATRVVCTVASTEQEQKLRSAIAGHSKYSQTIAVEICDLSSFDSVRATAQRLSEIKFDGILVTELIRPHAGQQQKTLTKDGFDEIFQVNHLSPYLLLSLLEEKLSASGKSVRISTAISDWYLYGDAMRLSYGQKPGGRNVTHLRKTINETLFLTFADTNLFRILTSFEFAKRHPRREIKFTVFSPGFMDIDFQGVIPEDYYMFKRVESYYAYFKRDSRQGALRGVQALTHPTLSNVTGILLDAYFAQPRAQVLSSENLQWNFENSEKLVGIKVSNVNFKKTM